MIIQLCFISCSWSKLLLLQLAECGQAVGIWKWHAHTGYSRGGQRGGDNDMGVDRKSTSNYSCSLTHSIPKSAALDKENWVHDSPALNHQSISRNEMRKSRQPFQRKKSVSLFTHAEFQRLLRGFHRQWLSSHTVMGYIINYPVYYIAA